MRYKARLNWNIVYVCTCRAVWCTKYRRPLLTHTAVSAPRFDCQGSLIDVEARIPERVCAGLRTRGHGVEKTAAAYWPFPLVHAICIDPVTGALDGGADPRGEGMALVV